MTMTPGQTAYEQERAEWPRYHDGTFRPAWDALPAYARASWERNPTPRDKTLLYAVGVAGAP